MQLVHTAVYFDKLECEDGTIRPYLMYQSYVVCLVKEIFVSHYASISGNVPLAIDTHDQVGVIVTVRKGEPVEPVMPP